MRHDLVWRWKHNLHKIHPKDDPQWLQKLEDPPEGWTEVKYHEAISVPRYKLNEIITTNNEGITYDTKTNVVMTEGFAVSINPQDEVIVLSSEFDPNTLGFRLVEYIDNHRGPLAEAKKYLGVWHHDKTKEIFLDVSTVVFDRDEAVRLARKFQQEGIFDISTKTYIPVGAREERVKTAASRKRGHLHHYTVGKKVGLPSASDVIWLVSKLTGKSLTSKQRELIRAMYKERLKR